MTTWMKLEDFMLKKIIIQAHKDKCQVISSYVESRKADFIGNVSSGCQSLGRVDERGREKLVRAHRDSKVQFW